MHRLNVAHNTQHCTLLPEKKSNTNTRLPPQKNLCNTSPVDRRPHFSLAVRTPTAGGGRRTAGATDIFLWCVRDIQVTHGFGLKKAEQVRHLHDRKMSVVPIDRRLYFPIAVPTPTVGDGRRTVGTTDMFL